jgi:cold shock CspA family protein
MLPFQEDPELARHLAAQQPKPAPARRQSSTETKLHLGTVARWNVQRAYGFVLSDAPVDGIPDKEVYCHRTGLPDGVSSLERGTRVEFRLVPPHLAGKPSQAKITKIVEAEEA